MKILKKMQWKAVFLVGAVLIVHMLLIFYYGNLKAAFHEDEYFTYYTSAAYEAINPWGDILETTGLQLQSHFYVTQEHRFAFRDIIDIHANDVHPPLYYLTLNCFMSLFPYSFYKWFGILLNSAYSLVSCLGLMFFVYKLDKSEHCGKLALTIGLLYAIHPATISNIMFTRMYAMSVMWTVLYMDVFVLLVQNYRGRWQKFGWITASGAAVCYFAFLTHYFCLYVPFFLTLGFCIYVTVRKLFFKETGFLRMFIYGLALLLGIGLAILSFPAALSHIFGGYQGDWAFQTLLDEDPWSLLKMFLPVLNRCFFAGALYPALVIFALFGMAGLGLLVWRKKRNLPKVSVDLVTLGIGVTAGIIIVWLTAETSQFLDDPAICGCEGRQGRPCGFARRGDWLD